MNFEEINNVLLNKLEHNESFNLIRLDNTAGYVLNCFFKNQTPSAEFFNEGCLLQGGIYPNTVNYYIENIVPRLIDVMKKSDILGIVDISNEIIQSNFLDNFPDVNYKFAGDINHYILDPGGLLGHSPCGSLTRPWTANLKNKKVLVISTHRESILRQWENIDKIWGSNRDLIAPFDLVDVIRSPYHPIMDDRQPPKCEHWLQSVDYTKQLIDNYDYDVLLSGSSSSSPFYVDHAKQSNKIGIQTGGVHQLFFGIKGFRWTKEVRIHEKWEDMYNEHWIYPLEVDEAQKRKQLLQLETNFAYW